MGRRYALDLFLSSKRMRLAFSRQKHRSMSLRIAFSASPENPCEFPAFGKVPRYPLYRGCLFLFSRGFSSRAESLEEFSFASAFSVAEHVEHRGKNRREFEALKRDGQHLIVIAGPYFPRHAAGEDFVNNGASGVILILLLLSGEFLSLAVPAPLNFPQPPIFRNYALPP